MELGTWNPEPETHQPIDQLTIDQSTEHGTLLEMKTKEQYIQILSNFKQKSGRSYGIRRLGIFGSVARGEQRNQSDIDIYYEGEPLSLFKLSELKDKLEQSLGAPVDIVRFRESMNHLLKERIEKEGLNV